MQTGDNIRDQIRSHIADGKQKIILSSSLRFYPIGLIYKTLGATTAIRSNLESLIKNQITGSSRVVEFNID